MERRLHPRAQVHFEARVTNLTTREQASSSRVCDMSKGGISAILPLRFVPADLVQLEVADSVLLGRVVYSNPEGSQFRIGIEVHKVKLGVSDVSNHLQETLRETMPSTPGLEHSEIYLG
jgi:PilZ domain